MNRKGRKSTDELAVVPTQELRKIDPPPKALNPTQAAIWTTVLSSPLGQLIPNESYPTLMQFCRVAAESDRIWQVIEAYDLSWLETDEGLKRYNTLVRLAESCTKQIVTLGAKLRIHPSERYKAEKAYDVTKNAKTVKPWVDG